jgi:molybdopterin synthase sulfur carrier subunit
MHITVSLFLSFRTGRFHTTGLDYPDGTTVKQVVDALALREGDVGTAIVNGREAELDQVLSGGDTLLLFPLVGGG